MGWYNAGTVTATNNSGTITGAGTAFISNIRVGDGVTIAGSTSLHEVTNIVSETQLTVSPVYPGTTGSGKTYGVVPVQGYVQGLADQAKQLILSFSTVGSSASVNALVAVTGTVDTIPYFTSGSTMVAKAASIDPIGSTIAVRTPGGSLAAGSLELGFNTTAFTPFIDFHSGIPSIDYDTRIISDAPTGAVGGGRMQHHANGGHFFNGSTGIYENGQKVYARNTILGAVGQTGGVPTAAIIERGANASGEYVRYADGTQICWSGSAGGKASPTIPANGTTAIVLSLPIAFAGNFNVWSTGWPYLNWDYYGTLVSVSSGVGAYQAMVRNGVTAQQFSMYFIAIGRWY